MEEKFKEFHALLGSKLRFKLKRGEFEGILQDLNPHTLTMDHVYRIPSRDYFGNLDYDLHEILSYEIVESKDTIRKYERFDYLINVVNRTRSTTKYDINDVLFNGELDEPTYSDEETVYEEDIETEEFVLKVPPELQNSLPVDSIILDDLNRDFHQAIAYILKQKVVGVSFEGSNLSRSGKISWICMSTDACTFLFDIEILKLKAFDEGLQNIFQNKNIVKVIHDCRQASDCLYHLYSTELTNVFDTQVADYIVTMQRYNGKHNMKYVNSLDGCLIRHLDVPQEYIRNQRKNFSRQEELNFFIIRPISNEYRQIFIKNSIYLVLLKEKLEKLLLEPFYKTVDIYLNVLSKASEAELLLNLSAPDTIPPAVLMKGIQTVRFEEVPSDDPVASLQCNFKDPVTGKVINSYKSLEPDFPKSSSESNCVENGEWKKEKKNKKKHESLNDNDQNIINSDKTSDSSKNSTMSDKNKFERIREIIALRQRNANPSLLETRISNKIDNVIQDQKSNSSANESVIVNEMSVRSSARQVDRIFYKSVNSHFGTNQAACNLIDVKPSSDYVSKFVQRQPLQSYHENCALFDTDYVSSAKSQSPDNMEEVWARCRAEYKASETGTYEHPKNYKFIPAGMS